MTYLKKSKNIFVSLLFSGSVNSNLYCGCCPCEKTETPSIGGDGEEKDNDKKQQEQNNNVINDLEGVVGLTCKLENNKIRLYTRVPNNDNYKFAESVEEFNDEFKYEKFKELRINIKIDEFGINWEDNCTIEEQIGFFKTYLNALKSFGFLSNKIIFCTKNNCVKDLSDMRIYKYMSDGGQLYFLQNVDENLNLKDYGIISNGKYYKKTNTGKLYDDSDKNQAEYKTKFLNGE